MSREASACRYACSFAPEPASSVGTGASRDATRERHNLRPMPSQNNKGPVYERCRERHA